MKKIAHHMFGDNDARDVYEPEKAKERAALAAKQRADKAAKERAKAAKKAAAATDTTAKARKYYWICCSCAF